MDETKMILGVCKVQEEQEYEENESEEDKDSVINLYSREGSSQKWNREDTDETMSPSQLASSPRRRLIVQGKKTTMRLNRTLTNGETSELFKSKEFKKRHEEVRESLEKLKEQKIKESKQGEMALLKY